MNICEKYGRKVYQYRVQKQFSQEQLAELADLHRTYISAVERGTRSIALKNIEKIAKALDVPIYKFFQYGGDYDE